MLLGIVCSKDQFNHPKPVNANISNEAEALLDFLYKISGKYILSGHHDQLLELAHRKPIALAEIGQMPTPGILNQQPQWTWFMGIYPFATGAVNKMPCVAIHLRSPILSERKKDR